MEFIPNAGACLATLNVINRTGVVRWMVRVPSQMPADNGWQIMSHLDTTEYLNDPANWRIVDFNDLCAIEPALIGIWDMPVGSDLQIVRDELGIRIFDTPTGRKFPWKKCTCRRSTVGLFKKSASANPRQRVAHQHVHHAGATKAGGQHYRGSGFFHDAADTHRLWAACSA